ncbi:RNA polymerase sigma factor [Fulvivirga sp. M361]|uniref:RNA polymerase sigma factor n=1 Tax=Fulvivirga sp. M361 TaxID=2594266 RepID=UPI001C872C0A|nr:sigma-70 family RNA polymerase sigma factor [Fulvivirga sp. M361]
MNETRESRKKLFLHLYQEVFPQLAAYISKRGGSLEDAKDLFQDALIIHYEQTRSEQRQESNAAYLFGISRHLWYKRYKENKASPMALENLPETAELQEPSHPSKEILLTFLEKVSQKCMELLEAVYYDKISMSQVAKKFGFMGERSATVQKYKCMEKVRELIKEKKMAYEDFVE